MALKRNLPDWFDAWLEYTSHSESPTIYHKWVAVSILAAVLERKVYLDWDKKIYPNFFIVIVGPPGCRKGTAMAPGRELLDELTVKISADATSKEKLAQRLEEASDTFEALDGNIHSYSAMTIFSEEFTVFLGYGQIDLMQWMSDWYDCKNNWRYETKHQGVVAIDGVWVNLLGATTPELLQETLSKEAFGGGLNSRIIYVYADQKEKLVVFPFQHKAKEELYQKIFHDIQLIRLTAGVYIPQQSYLDRYAEWYPTQHKIPLANDPKLAHYIDRRPTHLHKLAMVFNISRDGGLELEAQDFDRALALLEETEKFMGKTFAGLGQSPLASVMHKVLQFIRARGSVYYSELLGIFYNDADEKTFSIIISTLERGRIINLERIDNEGERDYLIHYLSGSQVSNPSIIE